MTQIVFTPANYTPNAPVFDGPPFPDLTLPVGTVVSFSAAEEFSDLEGDILEYQTVGPWPAWLALNAITGAVSGTAPLAAPAPGIFLENLGIRAFDSGGRFAESNLFDILVYEPSKADPPVFDGPDFGDLEVPVGVPLDPIDVAARFSDPVDTLTYQNTGRSVAGVTLDEDTGVFAGTPELPGVYRIQFQATDSVGNVTAANLFTLTVFARRRTYRDIVTQSLERAGAVAAGNAPAAETLDTALELLRDMLEEWRDQGLDLGATEDTIQLDARIPFDRGAVRAVTLNLAVEIATDLMLPVSPRLERRASDAMGDLSARIAGVTFPEMDPGLWPGRTSSHYDIDEEI